MVPICRDSDVNGLGCSLGIKIFKTLKGIVVFETMALEGYVRKTSAWALNGRERNRNKGSQI